MIDDSDPRRDHITQAIQHASSLPSGDPDDDLPEGSLVVGWALVVDYMSPDGDRWLSRAHSASLTKWQANGMYHEALHGDWSEEDR